MAKNVQYEQLLMGLQTHGYRHFNGVHRELKYLAKTMTPQNPPLAAIRGFVDNGRTVLVVLLKNQVQFIDCGLVYSTRTSMIPFKFINSVTRSKGLLTCNLVITNSAANTVVNDILVSDANRFMTALNQALESYDDRQTGDGVVDDVDKRLQQYAQLLADGTITKAEFIKLKTKLLE